MAKEKKAEGEKGAPMWVVTYGDLMSLLLTFFVLLLSFATMDKPREVEEAIISIKGAFGVLPKELTMIRINPAPVRMRRPNKEVEDLGRRVQRGLQVAGLQKDVKLTYDEAGGLKITLPGKVLYPSGQTRLRPESYPLLESLAELLSGLPETVFEIRGHTDNTSLSTDTLFRDNYDLSYARADAVVRFLTGSGKMPMSQFEIVACGASQPVASNSTLEGRSENRRVEIFVRGLVENSEVMKLQNRVDQLTMQ